MSFRKSGEPRHDPNEESASSRMRVANTWFVKSEDMSSDGIVLAIIMYIYLLIFTFNLKLAIEFKDYQDILIDIANVVGALLLGNIITLTI